MEKKLAVEDCYENKNQLCGGQPNLMEIARAHKVSKKFVRKIEGELYKHDGRVIYLEEITLVGDGMDNTANHTGKENMVLEDWL